MTVRNVVEGVFVIPHLFVNMFLIEWENDLVLVDAGMPGDDQLVLRALGQLGKQPTALSAILVTHLHQDHTGGLAAIQRISGAPVFMHAADASSLRQGINLRSVQAAPGWLNRLVCRMMPKDGKTAEAGWNAAEAVKIEHEVADGELLPLAGGIRVLHTPGHTAFLWERGGVLFAGDAVSGMFGKLGYSFIYENLQQGQESLRKIAASSFDTLCLSHGKPIAAGAGGVFRRSWRLIVRV